MLWACVLLCKKTWRGRGSEGGKEEGIFRAGEQFECLEVGEKFDIVCTVEPLYNGHCWRPNVCPL